jgi:hypothetical protein
LAIVAGKKLSHFRKPINIDTLTQRRFSMPVKQKTVPKTAASKKPGLSADPDIIKIEIEKRAKEIFLKRQDAQAPGDALIDWLQAEKEVKAQHLMC